MEQSEGPHGPHATGRPLGELTDPPGGNLYRERWADVLDALEIMGERGWRMVAGPNWTVEFGEGGEITVSVRPSTRGEPR